MIARLHRVRGRWRVPVRLQLNSVECGAACLAMILSFHGRPTTVAQTRRVCVSGRGGVSARDIADGARSFGIAVRGVRGEARNFDRLPLPVIAHWNIGHFVVVERWTRRRVDIVDPGWGRRRLTAAEFEQNLGKAVLVLQPGPSFARNAPTEPSSARVLTRLLAAVPGIRFVIAQILLATLILQALTLVLPLATKLIVDRVFGAQPHDELIGLLGVVFGVTVAAQVVTSALRALLLVYLQGRLDWNLMFAFAQHLYRLPMRYFHQRTSGDLALRLGSIGALRNLLANQTLTATLDITMVLSYVLVMFFVDPLLAGAVVLILIAQLAPAVLVRGRARNLVARHVAAQVKVQDYILQTLSGVNTIKASGAEKHVVAGLSERIADWAVTALLRGQLNAVLDAYAGLLRNLTPLLVLWLGALRVLDGAIGLGTLLGFMWLAAAVLGPTSALITNWQALQMAGVAMDRIGDVMRAEPEAVGTRLPITTGSSDVQMELRDVRFRYDTHGPPAIDGISAAVRKGQRIAIVGRSGAGKTTLAMLLLGLYPPSSGQVCFEGAPLDEYDMPAVRQRFGAVLQESFVLRGTVRENIAFAHPDATDEDVLRAARIAEVASEVDLLPMGYDTPLGERGTGLSGGQLQRLAIARALVGRPAMLVLDEATSHLDSETERRIVVNLRAVSCTQIVIAHRLSTIADADLILVVAGGRVVESGTHPDLVAAGGAYATLVAAQMPATPVPVAGG